MQNTFPLSTQKKVNKIFSVFIFTKLECDRSITPNKLTNPDTTNSGAVQNFGYLHFVGAIIWTDSYCFVSCPQALPSKMYLSIGRILQEIWVGGVVAHWNLFF
ncbi:hypothetical protein IQ230_20580 [Gloeocapsopsis crepidinum LEGE 06123]|uniref:Transposase n=1 Tax=Gloeocapsopsis crepidinum LEGE 06123 TaxID=588587 RepID=A0ABR9UWM3_9CHRO|nr:hypothetical protein [Gloeocapsopsis crepidinum]MBE9192702.1 hypothetical protein [Gloeocapsopsis crepidinum LEGE 06123]